jgi:hypothetical protein
MFDNNVIKHKFSNFLREKRFQDKKNFIFEHLTLFYNRYLQLQTTHYGHY